MSDDTPRRGYGLGDEPHFDDVPNDEEHTSAFRNPLNDDWFRHDEATPPPIPQRALRTRDEWADVPWGSEPRHRAEQNEDAVEPDAQQVSDPPAESAPAAVRVVDKERRRKLRTSLLLTLVSTVLPGAGLIGAPQRWLKAVGAVSAVAALAMGGYLLSWAVGDTASFASIAVDPRMLKNASFSLIGIGLLWVTLIAATHIATRPGGLIRGKRLLGALVVTALAFGVSAPSALGARYSHDQVMLVEKVFGGTSGDNGEDVVKSETRPDLGGDPEEDPWKDIPRVNVLLLGADGNEARKHEVEQYGIRTDTIILASIDTATGDTLLIQIPRNVRFTPFKEGSELHDIWPRGQRGAEEADAWLTNLWATVELHYPNVLQGNTYRGAEALKQGVESITGLEPDYFMMLNIDGLQRLINAMGGVRVNINEPLPMGTARNCRDPERCLQPGPDQKLNGYEAMWYARSRATTSDYSRMARQSCLIDAVIKQANPATMFTSYEGIADAASNMVTTDIPQPHLKAFVQLAFRVKDAKIQRLLYTLGKNGYSYENPDFEAMRQAVADALNPPEPEPTPSPTAAPTTGVSSPTAQPTVEPTVPGPSPTKTPDELAEGAQTVSDVCAWQGYDEEE